MFLFRRKQGHAALQTSYTGCQAFLTPSRLCSWMCLCKCSGCLDSLQCSRQESDAVIPWKLPRNTAFPLISTAPLLVSGRQVRLGRLSGPWLSGVLCLVGLYLMGLCKWMLIVKSVLRFSGILDLLEALEISFNPSSSSTPALETRKLILSKVSARDRTVLPAMWKPSSPLCWPLEVMGFVSLLRGGTRGTTSTTQPATGGLLLFLLPFLLVGWLLCLLGPEPRTLSGVSALNHARQQRTYSRASRPTTG